VTVIGDALVSAKSFSAASLIDGLTARRIRKQKLDVQFMRGCRGQPGVVGLLPRAMHGSVLEVHAGDDAHDTVAFTNDAKMPQSKSHKRAVRAGRRHPLGHCQRSTIHEMPAKHALAV
jgi:hypothetical protein